VLPILAEAESSGPVSPADSFDTCTGRGIRATYAGHVIGVGTTELMDELNVAVTPEAEASLARLR
jgi:cation transport ATPase